MPIRRSAAAPPKEDATPANAPEGDAPAEGSAPVGEKEKEKEKDSSTEPATTEDKKAGGDGEEANADGEEQAKDDGETPDGEKTEEAAAEQGKSKKKKVKDVVAKIDKEGDDKGKKVKKKIPAWATISANKLASASLSQPKVEEILIEAIESCKERSGASSITIMKYVMKKYPSVEMDKKTKNLYKRALKRLVEKGTVKQLKGKGFSGSFAIGKKSASSAGAKETLGESLPLIITRLCEPKEASYILIKKYLEQYFPQLNVENRPDVLKNCLQRSVEKGYLEQITGKGASGTFQLKKAGNKVLMGGGLLEDAIVAAITAMNEPKTCSITILRKFLMEKQDQKNVRIVVPNLKRTLQKCKMMGWMEQISGHGLSGSYQLSYPYYPSPAVLFPEMMEKLKQKEGQKLKRKRSDDSDEESEADSEEESEEEESEEDEPPRRKRNQRRNRQPASKARQNKRAKTVSRKPPASKRSVAPAKKAPPPAKKPAAASKAASKKAPAPVKATPVKKAAPTSKPKTPIAKKMTSRGSKRPSPKAAKKEATESAVKAKPAARKSLRSRK
ncbi:heterochromatin protein 1-binding protein 3 [Megalobrama amblycephala]|uniref:heterochromatin protein 1-binding protein 3 n=1 Tax=Megalobrama amblycephala TaxID=75352 RepID=UPI0020146884|nr:heterochromatin protein 1-binding protein 3 [Megalobrama amblycephala]